MEKNRYRVEDTESGNYVIYEGNDLREAKKEIIQADMEGLQFDLYNNDERVWCPIINTIEELEEYNG